MKMEKLPTSMTWGWSVRFLPVVPESVMILSRNQDEDKAGFAALFQLYLGISYFSLSSSFFNCIDGSLVSMSWLL